MASFSKADAKVRLIFELPKLFRSFFQKVFFEAAGSNSCSFVQYFNSSAFLSRKRVQKYCFTAYTPNHPDTYFILFCFYMPKSLILKRCRRAYFYNLWFQPIECPTLLFIYARIQGIYRNNLHFIHRPHKQQIYNI